MGGAPVGIGSWRDWQALRQSRKNSEQWEPAFAAANGGFPHETIHKHLEDIYKGQPLEVWEGEDEEPTPPFTLQELQDAAERGKLKKAVGSDEVSHELLLQITRDENAAPKLLEWFNSILMRGEMPQSWNEVVMVVLPKIRVPLEAKHVRPISLSSATCKLFSRMLLERCKDKLGEPGGRQCSGPGRQASDFVFTIHRLMHVEREWRLGMRWIKVDVQEAFDRVSRHRLMRMLLDKLGHNRLTKDS